MTWASNATRHPWFISPTMKRKLCANGDSDDDPSFSEASPSAFLASRRKRVRHDSLERTLAHMTLGNALAPTPEDVGMWPRTSSPRPRVQEIILPSSIEEPSTPVASEPDDMEVEPTLVVPASGDWDSIQSGQLDIREVHISPAALECIRRQAKCPPPVPLSSQTSQALVLYRVPCPPSPTPSEQDQCTRTYPQMVRGDDVMEVE